MRLYFQRKPPMGTRSDAGSSLNQKHLVQPSLATPLHPGPPPLPSPHYPLQKGSHKTWRPSAFVPPSQVRADMHQQALTVPCAHPASHLSPSTPHLLPVRPLNMCTSCSVRLGATSLILGGHQRRAWRLWLEKGISEFSSLEVGSSEVPL